MNSKLRIAAVEPLPGNHSLRLVWSDGRVLSVNLSEALHAFGVLAPLQDSALFQQAQVGEWGFDVVWPGDIELSATTLYRLAMEQAGEAMPKSAFKAWMHRHGLSLTGAAQALHLTRRTITAYSSGPNPIPYHIALACKGWEVMHGANRYSVGESGQGAYNVGADETGQAEKSSGRAVVPDKNGAY